MNATQPTHGQRGHAAPARVGPVAAAHFRSVFYTRRSIDLMRVCSSVCR